MLAQYLPLKRLSKYCWHTPSQICKAVCLRVPSALARSLQIFHDSWLWWCIWLVKRTKIQQILVVPFAEFSVCNSSSPWFKIHEVSAGFRNDCKSRYFLAIAASACSFHDLWGRCCLNVKRGLSKSSSLFSKPPILSITGTECVNAISEVVLVCQTLSLLRSFEIPTRSTLLQSSTQS